MQTDSIQEGQNVLVVDDLIATGSCASQNKILPSLTMFLLLHHCLTFPGGSAKAAGELVVKQAAKTVGYLFVIGLPSLKGHEQLDAPCYSIIQADDEYPEVKASDQASEQLKNTSK